MGPLEDDQLVGRPRLWNSDLNNDEAETTYTFSKKNKRQMWWDQPTNAIIDISEPLQWLSRRTLYGTPLSLYLSPGYYCGKGWWRFALDPQLDHVVTEDMRRSGEYITIFHGTKVMS